jgi:ABC-2 type transport system permease protein
MIPLTSPIVMLMRIPFGVPLWQIAISVTLLFGSFFVSFGLLQSVPNWDTMYGKKPTWSEMYWLKYKAGSALLKLN